MSPSGCEALGLGRILVVTGVAREAKIAAGPGIETMCSGGSPARLRQLLSGAERPEAGAVISFGIAGGLDPALVPGDVVVASGISFDQGNLLSDTQLIRALMAALPSKATRAVIAGVDAAVASPAEKSALHRTTGAAVVDMESHIAAQYAARFGLPFAAIRVVCDPAGHGLPPLVNAALTPEGSVSLRGVVGSLLRHPRQIPALIRLAGQSATAFRSLAAAAPALRSLS